MDEKKWMVHTYCGRFTNKSVPIFPIMRVVLQFVDVMRKEKENNSNEQMREIVI